LSNDSKTNSSNFTQSINSANTSQTSDLANQTNSNSLNNSANSIQNTSNPNTSETGNLVNQTNPNALNNLGENTNTSHKENQSRLAKKTNTLNSDNITTFEDMTDLDLFELTEIDNPVKQISQPLEDIIDTTEYQNQLKLKDYLTKIRYATPISNIELGVSSGLDFLYHTNDFSSFSSKYGITSEITLSDHIKLGTTIDWKQTSAELDDIAQGNYSDEYFENFPDMVGTNPYDQLNKVEMKDQAIEFSLFAKYIVQPHHKWSPYFGIGIKGEYDYKQQFEYKYLNNLGYEYEMDYVYFDNKQLAFNTLLGLAGIQYKLSPNINIRVDAMYNYDYKSHRFDASQMNWISTNIGILYKFK
jgi:hypothetical protein